MEISEEEEEEEGSAITTGAAHHQPSAPSGSSPSSSPAAAEPASSPPPPISDSAQHFGSALHPPLPSYPPHLPPPPPPGYSLQPPPPPGIPPLPHMELHPEYPPPMPHHMYDYAASMELMSQYSGGAPMSFQMQTHMLSRLQQLRTPAGAAAAAAPNGAAGPGEATTADYASYHLHPLPHQGHHAYLEQEGGGGAAPAAHYDQDHRYMPAHAMPYAYPDPHAAQMHHGVPPPHAGWPPHMPPPSHYPSYLPPPPPPGYSAPLASGAGPAGEGGDYGAPGEELPVLADQPHQPTVQLVLAALIQEMKNIMQRDLNRKMVENVAFATFDEWWDRKETKAKVRLRRGRVSAAGSKRQLTSSPSPPQPFQTMVRGVSALRDDDKKEEKVSRPREPHTSLVDWAKSGGMEGFALRGAMRLPSFKVRTR